MLATPIPYRWYVPPAERIPVLPHARQNAVSDNAKDEQTALSPPTAEMHLRRVADLLAPVAPTKTPADG